jgi:phosphatidylinositol 3-kinase
MTSQIAFTIWDVQGAGKAVPVGGTTMSMFNTKRFQLTPAFTLSTADFRTLKRGQQRLYVHREVEADPRLDSTTPGEMPTVDGQDEMGRLEAVSSA